MYICFYIRNVSPSVAVLETILGKKKMCSFASAFTLNLDALTQDRSSVNWLAHIALLFVAIFYGINYFVAKEVFAEIPPFALVAIRTSLTTLILVGAHAIWVKERIQKRSDYWRLALCGLFGSALNQTFFFKGLSLTVEVNAAVLMTTTPLFVFISAFILRTEKLTLLKIGGLVLAFNGAALLTLGGRELSFGQDTLAGDLMILTNAASYGLYLVIARPLMQRYHFLTIVKWVFLYACLITVPLGIPDLLSVDWGTVSSGAYLRTAYIVLFVTIGTYTLNGYALKQLSSAAVGIYIYLQPVLVACISFFWGSRPISGMQWVFMAMVLAGVYGVTYRKKTAQTTG